MMCGERSKFPPHPIRVSCTACSTWRTSACGCPADDAPVFAEVPGGPEGFNELGTKIAEAVLMGRRLSDQKSGTP